MSSVVHRASGGNDRHLTIGAPFLTRRQKLCSVASGGDRVHAGAGGAARRAARRTTTKLLDPDTVAELAAEPRRRAGHARVWKQMCADGWAGIGWPKEYGGQGRSAIEQFIFFDESMRAGRPGADAHDQHASARRS